MIGYISFPVVAMDFFIRCQFFLRMEPETTASFYIKPGNIRINMLKVYQSLFNNCRIVFAVLMLLPRTVKLYTTPAHDKHCCSEDKTELIVHSCYCFLPNTADLSNILLIITALGRIV